MDKEAKYYLLKMESYQGEGSSIWCYPITNHQQDYVFCVVAVGSEDAEMVDAGYVTAEELFAARKDLKITQPKQATAAEDTDGQAEYYVLDIDSREWPRCQIWAEADNEDLMHCVLAVYDKKVIVMDWGYSSIQQLCDAWNNKKFINLN